MLEAGRRVWITGASTGIGRDLALQLAARGLHVAASARSADKLAELARGNDRIRAYPLDVTDRAAVHETVRAISADLGPIDLAILNAGVWHPMKASEFDAGRAVESININYIGIVNALEPLISDMIAARKGHIALVASVAGYRGLPMAAAYAPSKAAIVSLAEVLRLELSRHGVKVSLINPGFVETPMTAVNTFPMPFILKPDHAARRIIRGLDRGKFEIAFPWQLVAILKLLRVLPYRIFFRVAGRL